MFEYIDCVNTSFFDVTYKNVYYELAILNIKTGIVDFFISDKSPNPDVTVSVT